MNESTRRPKCAIESRYGRQYDCNRFARSLDHHGCNRYLPDTGRTDVGPDLTGAVTREMTLIRLLCQMALSIHFSAAAPVAVECVQQSSSVCLRSAQD